MKMKNILHGIPIFYSRDLHRLPVSKLETEMYDLHQINLLFSHKFKVDSSYLNSLFLDTSRRFQRIISSLPISITRK